MSWNKNTTNLSKLDIIASTLDSAGIKYELKELGQVKAMGLNDEYLEIENYKLRSLIYKGISGVQKIIAEQMQRTDDCDSDDFIISIGFNGKLPDDFKIEINLDENCTEK